MGGGQEEVLSDDDFDDGQFSGLSANRIVLKRAVHVSEAEDTSGAGEE